MTIQALLARVVSAIGRVVRVETAEGEPFIVQGKTLVPVSQAIHMGGVGPGGGGGFVWNRPVAVIEEIGPGIDRRYPIRDVTLRTICGILLAAVALRVLIGLLFGRRS